MLERIAPAQVQQGMFIVGFEGSWWNHPFWRAKFLISDGDDLARVRSADVDAVLIDSSKGRGLATPGARSAADHAVTRVATARSASVARSTKTYLDENARAARIVERSKRVVRAVFEEARLGKAVRTGDVREVVHDVAGSLERSPKAMLGLVRLKSKHDYSCMHSIAVCVLMVNLARQMQLGDEATRDLGMAGLLHDVGKMAVPDELLNKPGRLDEREFAIVRQHPEHGHAMLAGTDGLPAQALDVCRHHHEKMDGTGYPFGLRGDQISLAARMGAICDVYDALTSDRVYKQAWAPAEAIGAMRGWDGHFDPALLFAFMRSLSVFPTGMLVRLRTNRLAVVLDNGARASRPRVKAFYAARDKEMLEPATVVIGDSLAHDQILSEEDPRHWALDDWAGLQARLLKDR